MLEAIVNPDDELMAVRLRAFISGYEEGLADPEAVQLEREHPGISKAVADALIPIFKENVRAQMPSQHRRFARFFEANFDAAEISRLIVHFSAAKGPATIATLSAQVPPRASGFTASATYAKFLAALPALRKMQDDGRTVAGSQADVRMREAVGPAVQAFLAAEQGRTAK